MVMHGLDQYRRVRVRMLLTAGRHYDGSGEVKRPPAVGDFGTIVEVLRPPEREDVYVVESVTPRGLTVWLADFHSDELEVA